MKKIPVILTCLYLGLLILGVIPIFTGEGPLSGIFAVILAAPWTMLLGKLIGAKGDSVATGLALVAVGGLINATLIYFVSRWVVRCLGR